MPRDVPFRVHTAGAAGSEPAAPTKGASNRADDSKLSDAGSTLSQPDAIAASGNPLTYLMDRCRRLQKPITGLSEAIATVRLKAEVLARTQFNKAGSVLALSPSRWDQSAPESKWCATPLDVRRADFAKLTDAYATIPNCRRECSIPPSMDADVRSFVGATNGLVGTYRGAFVSSDSSFDDRIRDLNAAAVAFQGALTIIVSRFIVGAEGSRRADQ